MIEHIALIAAGIRRPIKMADLRTDSLGQILEGSLESPAVERAQGRAYGINRDEVMSRPSAVRPSVCASPTASPTPPDVPSELESSSEIQVWRPWGIGVKPLGKILIVAWRID